MKPLKRFIKYTFIFYAIIAFIYWFFIRPQNNNWGATSAEISVKMLEDDSISPNRVVSTRAITIHATKENMWTWVAQTGQNRGGFNSYYWLENLFGAKMVNNDIPNPEWQNPQRGDTVYYGHNQPFTLVSLVKPNEYYSLGGWAFHLQSIDSNNTRLVVRYPSMDEAAKGAKSWMPPEFGAGFFMTPYNPKFIQRGEMGEMGMGYDECYLFN